ncbi:hypothetical protein ES288_A09G198000v1 [Gossypium darwinii]|uniref:DUF3741 domain-containing protein n=1 Tax=Gossypium darwinii TaxID=34276 RepID=A0A5D2FCI3_GOSDA|nr:hypothetical protein ES288_A09G198000v1 [Gossypium darwinii]TYH03150.1 hypothetical protein ES288_A09G198000v1 [Gossypium darwinii]
MSNTKRSGSGCFSSVLRRILCSGTPQTHPSDHIVGLNTVDDIAKVEVQASETGPGIVARLMGLDSFPENNWLQKSKIPGPVTRSRSVNFMDYMLELDFKQAKHRRVRTSSSSFREVPQGPQLFHHNQNQDFLVVYLDNEYKNNEAAGFKPRKSEKRDRSGSKHGKQKDNVLDKVVCKKQIREKNKKISKLKNEPRRVSGKHSFKAGSCINGTNSKALKVANQKEVSVVTRKTKNQRPVKKIEYSENPFVVHGVSEVSRSLEVKSKKWSSKSVKHDSLTTTDTSARISIPEGLGKQENFESRNVEETEYYMELVDKLSKLTEGDIKFSNWETKKVFIFEEICAEFEEHILDHLLQQVADELVGFHTHVNLCKHNRQAMIFQARR